MRTVQILAGFGVHPKVKESACTTRSHQAGFFDASLGVLGQGAAEAGMRQ
jgi:hypothetical protein